MRIERLYIAVSPTLTPGLAAAQAIHAALGYREEHGIPPETVVVLSAEPLEVLGKLRPEHRRTLWREPDLGDALTAVACGPEASRILRDMPLL